MMRCLWLSNVENVKKYYNDVDVIWQSEDLMHHHIGYFETQTTSLREAQDNVVELIEKNLGLRENDIVLDIGCGSGIAAVQMAERHKCNVIGVNISEVQVKKALKLISAKKMNNRIKIVKKDIHKLELEENSIDGAYAIESIMHLTKPLLLDDIYRYLKKGAIFSFCDWYIKTPLTDEEAKFLSKNTCGNYLNMKDYLSLLENSKFIEFECMDWTENTLKTYEYWSTVTPAMQEKIDAEFLEEIDRKCTSLSELAKRKLGYFQVTMVK